MSTDTELTGPMKLRLHVELLNANAIAFAKAVVAQKVSPSAYLPAAFAAASSSATRAPCSVLPSE